MKQQKKSRQNSSFESITIEEVTEALRDDNESFTNEELLQIEHRSRLDDFQSEEKNKKKKQQNLCEFFELTEKLKEKLNAVEDDETAKETFCAVLDGLMKSYKKKQQ